MTFAATVAQLLLSSPCDLPQEHREVVIRAIRTWNNSHGRRVAVIFSPTNWEEGSSPEYGVGPQDALNRHVVDSSLCGNAYRSEPCGRTGSLSAGQEARCSTQTDAWIISLRTLDQNGLSFLASGGRASACAALKSSSGSSSTVGVVGRTPAFAARTTAAGKRTAPYRSGSYRVCRARPRASSVPSRCTDMPSPASRWNAPAWGTQRPLRASKVAWLGLVGTRRKSTSSSGI